MRPRALGAHGDTQRDPEHVGRRHGLLFGLFALSLTACVTPSPSPSAEPIAAAVSPQPTAPPQERPSDAELRRLCVGPGEFAGFPRAPALERPFSIDQCRLPDPATARTLERRVDERWARHADDSKLVFHTRCDRLDDDLHRVRLQTGSGHGHGLQLFELRRDLEPGPDSGPDSGRDQWTALRLTYVSPERDADYRFLATRPARVERATIPDDALADPLDFLRAGLHVDVEERLEPRMGGSFHMSSGDFHLRVELADGFGAIEGQFTGYPGSGAQSAFMTLDVGAEPLLAVLDSIEWTEAPIDDDARRAFAVAFLTADRYRGTDNYWWVEERMLGMAASLGSPQILPSVFDQLFRGGEVELGLAVIAEVTGWDLRNTRAGQRRPPGDVLSEYFEACIRASTIESPS